MLSWNLRGRSATAVFDPNTQYKILHSQEMMRCANKPLLWIVEELANIDVIAGLTGPLRKVEYFVCLIMRLLQITPSPCIVMRMLEQDVHKYMRVAAIFIIRLIGNEAMMKEAIKIGWSDYRKVRIYGSNISKKNITKEKLLTGNTLYEQEVKENYKRKRDNCRENDLQAMTGVNEGQEFVPSEEDKMQMRNVLELSSNVASYFIWRIDELVDELFDVPLHESVELSESEPRVDTTVCARAEEKVKSQVCDDKHNYTCQSGKYVVQIDPTVLFLGIPLTKICW